MSSATQPKACGTCGRTPPIIASMFTGQFYVACCDLQTKACPTHDEAISLWNAQQYEQPLPPRAPARPRAWIW